MVEFALITKNNMKIITDFLTIQEYFSLQEATLTVDKLIESRGFYDLTGIQKQEFFIKLLLRSKKLDGFGVAKICKCGTSNYKTIPLNRLGITSNDEESEYVLNFDDWKLIITPPKLIEYHDDIEKFILSIDKIYHKNDLMEYENLDDLVNIIPLELVVGAIEWLNKSQLAFSIIMNCEKCDHDLSEDIIGYSKLLEFV